SAEHIEVLARSWKRERAEGFALFDAQLADLARVAPVDKFREVVALLADQFDGDGGAGRDRDDNERQYAYLSELANGMGKLDALLCPENLALVKSVLDSIMERDRDAGDDPARTRPRRRADALAIAFRLLSEHSKSLITGDEPAPTSGGRML